MTEKTTGPAEPQIRIGLAVGAPSATVGGAGGLVVTDPSGAQLAVIPPGEAWRVVVSGVGISAQPPGRVGTAPSEMIAVVASDPSGLVRVNGRGYRGIVEIVRDTAGLTVVNRLLLEAYLLGRRLGGDGTPEPGGVRGAEGAGRGVPDLRASATWAPPVARLRSPRQRGRPGVLGASSESPEGVEAVAATRAHGADLGRRADRRVLLLDLRRTDGRRGRGVRRRGHGRTSGRSPTWTRTARRTAGSLPATGGGRSGPATRSARCSGGRSPRC